MLLTEKNELKETLKNEIEKNGAMSYSEFFHRCLTDEKNGYYMNSNVFNKKGDFITSPEISQMFGEIIGIWHVMLWEKKKLLNKKRSIIEIGPGTGKLQIVLLNVFLQMGVLNNLNVQMIEVSPFLRSLQQKEINLFFLKKNIILEHYKKNDYEVFQNKKMNFKIIWHTKVIKGLEFIDKFDNPINFIAHEFFDALPSLKFKFYKNFWHEELIDIEKIKNLNSENFKHIKEKTFKTTLSLPNTSSVKNILKPDLRFKNIKIEEGKKIEISPICKNKKLNFTQI